MGNKGDRKEQTKPYVSIVVLEAVNDIRRHMGWSSNGETSRKIVLAAHNDWPVIGRLQPFLRWDYTRGDHIFHGHADHEPITSVLPGQWHRVERLPIRFTQDDLKLMEVLHACLSCPWAHMIGALLRFGIESARIIEHVAPGYVPRSKYSLRRGVWS